MAILSNNQRIGKYEAIRLIKENNYCETYRVEDEKEEPFFLKLFILKNTPYGEEFPNLKYPLPLTFGCNLST